MVMATEEEKCVFINGTRVQPCLGRDPEDSLKMMLNKRRSVYPLCGVLMGSVLAVWLLGLTMVREYQLSALRQEVALLKLDVEDIKQKVLVDGLMDELKGFERQVSA